MTGLPTSKQRYDSIPLVPHIGEFHTAMPESRLTVKLTDNNNSSGLYLNCKCKKWMVKTYTNNKIIEATW